MNGFLRFLTSARTSWLVLVVAFAGVAALFTLGSGAESETAPDPGLPDSAASVQVEKILESFPDADTTSALLVFASDDGEALPPDTVGAIQQKAFGDLVDLTPDGFIPPPQVSEDGTVALLVVPLAPEEDVEAQSERADEIRTLAADGLTGVDTYLTGPEGFEVDIAAVFDGADFTLLLTTVIVVAVLLLITYRSPWLWLVPLVVIGVADASAGIVARRIAALAGVQLDASVTGILSVLVFGAGTNYALLLIARYRDELRLAEDRREAMRRAVRGSGPAIIASGSTVALALATLLLGELSGNRALGLACAIGIVVAMAFALLVLPAALVLFGRGLFWPYIPRFGSPDAIALSPWGKLGRAVSRRPIIVALSGAVVLGALASGLFFVQTGLSQNDRFLQKPDAVRGQEVLAEAFSAGATSPATVMAPVDDAAAVVEAATAIDGVDSARLVEETTDWARIDVTLDASAETPEAFAAIERMRADFDGIGSGEALVGGLDARALDVAGARDPAAGPPRARAAAARRGRELLLGGRCRVVAVPDAVVRVPRDRYERAAVQLPVPRRPGRGLQHLPRDPRSGVGPHARHAPRYDPGSRRDRRRHHQRRHPARGGLRGPRGAAADHADADRHHRVHRCAHRHPPRAHRDRPRHGVHRGRPVLVAPPPGGGRRRGGRAA